ncbi:MAG: zinc ABC transporter substrate-binding protein [Acetobacteraceae bacterium]
MLRLVALLGAALVLLVAPGRAGLAAPARAGPTAIVAAESVYADVARQIAGPAAEVSAILTNPDQDPHLFEVTPSVARAVARARIVVLNGADYDPWMRRLIAAQPDADRIVIDVAQLVHAGPGANPHLWYDPAAIPAYARALARALGGIDPAGADRYVANLRSFLDSRAPLDERIAAMRRRWSGVAVAATEPVFGLMAAALGLDMREPGFQRAVMNGTEPSPSETAGFERDLRGHAVRVLIVNIQASDAAVERLRRIAGEAGIPVVGVTETEPPGQTYQGWMLSQLDALEAALAR